jgi:hypothetical protein
MCCRDCGKVLAVDNVPPSKILDFVASGEANGWTFDANGFVCCPECSKAAAQGKP